MALSSSRSVGPGDGSVATAAYRSGTGTRASALQRVDQSGETFVVNSRHEWRPGEDHGGEGNGNSGSGSRRRMWRSELDFTPLVMRFAAAYVANEPPADAEAGSLVRTFYADVQRGVQVYEGNLRILAAAMESHGEAAGRGQQINRLS